MKRQYLSSRVLDQVGDTPPDPGPSVNVLDLPLETLLRVFSKVDFWTRRTTLSLVCRTWRDLVLLDPELLQAMTLDFSAECRPSSGIYPGMHLSPFVSLPAVGAWVQRKLPLLPACSFTCLRSRSFNVDPLRRYQVLPQDFTALLGMLSPKLASLCIEACDDIFNTHSFISLWCCSNVTSLRLRDIGFEVFDWPFDRGLEHLRKLQEFEIHCHAPRSGWGLHTFPTVLCGLTQLRVIRLLNQGDINATLPDSISSLQSLTQLDVRGSRLAGLGDEFGALSALASLTIDDRFPSRAQRFNLNDPRRLANLSGLGFTAPSLVDLTNMRSLSIQNSFPSAPPTFLGQLTSLCTLDLSNNLLSDLPTNLTVLGHLQVLVLSHNILSAVPVVVCTMTSLRRLELANNLLCMQGSSALPRSISRLQLLVWLDLSGNSLQVLPSAISLLTGLQTLLLRSNNISYIGSDEMLPLQCLTSISMRRNELQEVPPVFGKLKALRTINLEGNLWLSVQKPLDFLLNLPNLWRFTIRLRPELADERTRAHLQSLERALHKQHGRNVLEIIY